VVDVLENSQSRAPKPGNPRSLYASLRAHKADVLYRPNQCNTGVILGNNNADSRPSGRSWGENLNKIYMCQSSPTTKLITRRVWRYPNRNPARVKYGHGSNCTGANYCFALYFKVRSPVLYVFTSIYRVSKIPETTLSGYIPTHASLEKVVT
jgi:hypothetical protein